MFRMLSFFFFFHAKCHLPLYLFQSSNGAFDSHLKSFLWFPPWHVYNNSTSQINISVPNSYFYLFRYLFFLFFWKKQTVEIPLLKVFWIISEKLRQTALSYRWLHLEPWNQNARYLLILNCLQKAREERYPQHLCILLERLISVALSDHLYSNKDKSYQYQKFQLLLCASEICFQCGDHVGCISHANNASGLLLPDCYLFFAHLLLCRIFASEENFVSLREEYMRCMELKTDYPIGWIYLKYMESRYKLQTGAVRLELNFEECSKEIKHSWNMWMAVFNLVQGLVSIWTQDFLCAEKFLSEACSLATAQCCLFLCHGILCQINRTTPSTSNW